MTASIRELSSKDEPAIRAFNARLKDGGIEFAFTISSQELMQRGPAGEAPYQTAYVMTDGPSVRGGYILKDEQLFARGEFFSAGNYQLPLSEGIVDRKYAIVGVQLIKDALMRQSRLYSLGMGGMARPLPRLLQRLGWAMTDVPFLFRIEKPGNFTREIRWLRQHRGFRYALDIARFTGVLTALTASARSLRRMFGFRPPPDAVFTEVATFPREIDELFSRVAGNYGLLCDRRSASMHQKMPPHDPKLSRLVLHKSGELAGWIITSRSRLNNHKQFGNMTLGCIVDGLAAPSDVPILVAEACRRLEAEACDLLVSNQTHPAWIAALRRQGFFAGPSNFVLALSPDLVARASVETLHFTRGDGDGPINL